MLINHNIELDITTQGNKQMIINLTQHKATPEQIKEGVVDLHPASRSILVELLTFDRALSADWLSVRASEIAELATRNVDNDGESNPQALIGGAPFFMSALEKALIKAWIEPVYAFSQRESVEVTADDGSVLKKSVFKHVGFVRPHKELFE